MLARQLGIPLVTFDEVDALDWAVDGADEVDPAGNMIKGYGGALVREKIVATSARRFLILVGPEKLVPVLGSRGIVPVEVVPFGVGPASRRLQALGLKPRPRMHDSQRYTTDNGNTILDCETSPIPRPEELESAVRAIPGVLGTGLFLGMNPTVLIATDNGVTVRG
jgi:ribose 5-phosphate isomerase A